VEKLTETTTETTTTTAKPKKKTRRSSKSKPKVAVENKTIDTPTPPKLTEAPQPTEDPKLKELLEKKRYSPISNRWPQSQNARKSSTAPGGS